MTTTAPNVIDRPDVVDPYLTDLQRSWGPSVRARRRALGMTLAAVAAKAGVSEATISQIENAKSRGSLRAYCAIACALDMEMGELFPWPPVRGG